jgi:hypothetical protein
LKTTYFWLLILAAIAMAAPLGAEEINAPESHWPSTALAEPATVNWLRVAEDAQEVAQQSPATTEPKNAEPKKPSPEPTKSADDQESHRRVLGLAPMFGVVNDASKARPLSVGGKWKLFYRQTYDPFQFLTTGLSSAINQAEDEFPEYGQGMKGYAKRYRAGFADHSLGAFFGNFALPSLLHDDPRYFRKGSGPVVNRLLYAARSAVIARHDDGTSHPNYSNVFGNLIGCAFGNLYYPKSGRGVGHTIDRGLEMTASGAIGGIFQEFWPDIQKKVFKKHKLAEVK